MSHREAWKQLKGGRDVCLTCEYAGGGMMGEVDKIQLTFLFKAYHCDRRHFAKKCRQFRCGSVSNSYI